MSESASNEALHIWIDLANSPHVQFFAPIVRDLEAAGHRVALTARDFAQTLQLAEVFGLDVERVGEHGGGNRLLKVANIAGRALALRRYGRGRDFDLAVSHNSYAQAVAARLLGIPTATLMDYEFQPANHISFRLAHLVMVPSAIPEDMLQRQGAMARRTFQYDGLKEEVYLEDYEPDPTFFGQLQEAARTAGKSLEPDHVLIVLRPPATMAAYHRFDNPLFIQIVQRLGGFAQARQIVLPRTPLQRVEIEKHLPDNAFIPERVLDGRHLIHTADLVVSAGGTMNREAAVLGTPVYSIFAGRLGAVDRRLIDEGRMVLVRNPEDFEQIRVEKKTQSSRKFDFPLRSLLIEKCLELAYAQKRKRARN